MNTKHLIAALALGAIASPTLAADIIVPDDVPTLELALNPAVSGLAPGDTIVLRAGLYAGAFTVGVQDITIRPFGDDAVTIDSFGTGSVLTVGAMGSGLILEDLIISGGGGVSQGGGMLIDGTTVTIRRCTFRDNEVIDDGAAIRSRTSTLIIEDSLFENNTLELPNTTDDGGAILAEFDTNITITGTTFRNNHANFRGGALAIFNDAVLTMSDCLFEMNRSFVDGGAIAFVNGGRGTISDTLFQDNIADNAGGGIYSNGSWPHFSRCTFTRNEASGNGGGAAAIQGETTEEVRFFNCLLYNNIAELNGGALLTLTGPDPSMDSCTIVGNQIRDTVNGNGGGIWEAGGGTATRLSNSILRDNIPTQYPVSRTNVAFYCNVSGGELSGNLAIIDEDPMFVDAAGGNFRLMPGSPSIDAGDTRNYSDDQAPIDLAGNDRCVTDPDSAGTGFPIMRLYTDHGAYEFQPTLPCTSDCVGDTTTTGATLDGQPGFGEPDGVIDLDDLGFFLGQWLVGCP
ncbi:MAG: right-handed parallel beta-helix repeat-containing protein [Planctomycetota bacterium]